MNNAYSKQANQAEQQILDLGQVSATTLGGGGYLSEGNGRSRPSYHTEFADLGKATELTLGGGNYGMEHIGGSKKPRL